MINEEIYHAREEAQFLENAGDPHAMVLGLGARLTESAKPKPPEKKNGAAPPELVQYTYFQDDEDCQKPVDMTKCRFRTTYDHSRQCGKNPFVWIGDFGMCAFHGKDIKYKFRIERG